MITLDIKWGPGDIFVVELKDGKVTRTTNLLAKMHAALVSDYKKAKAAPYNDVYDFVFETGEDPICELNDSGRVKINARATTDPNGARDARVWDGRIEATWEIRTAKFTAQKVTRKFAGKRKHEE